MCLYTCDWDPNLGAAADDMRHSRTVRTCCVHMEFSVPTSYGQTGQWVSLSAAAATSADHIILPGSCVGSKEGKETMNCSSHSLHLPGSEMFLPLVLVWLLFPTVFKSMSPILVPVTSPHLQSSPACTQAFSPEESGRKRIKHFYNISINSFYSTSWLVVGLLKQYTQPNDHYPRVPQVTPGV